MTFFRVAEYIVHQWLGLPPIVRFQKIERHRYTLKRDWEFFPQGTVCWLSRANPDSFVVLEFDDGSVIELGSWIYIEGIESISVRDRVLSLVNVMTHMHELREDVDV